MYTDEHLHVITKFISHVETQGPSTDLFAEEGATDTYYDLDGPVVDALVALLKEHHHVLLAYGTDYGK